MEDPMVDLWEMDVVVVIMEVDFWEVGIQEEVIMVVDL